VTFDKSKPKPAWLARERFGGAHAERRWEWYNRIWDAQPPWANRKAINRIYREAKRRRAAGEDVVVDHIIPLFHSRICGLHVETNLRIVDRKLNARKSNFVKGLDTEQYDMLDVLIAPPDFELEVQDGV